MDPMDRRETIRFSESCRLCLQQPGLFNVFKIKGLLLDIYEFTGVKVFLAGDLPQMICRECSTIIQNIKELKETAATNDAHMRSLVSDKLEPSEQVEQVFIQEVPNSVVLKLNFNESNELCSIKQEPTPEKSPLSDVIPPISQVAVRSDLFSSAENEVSSDTPSTTKWVNGIKIKKEVNINDIEPMYDSETSLLTETTSHWFAPEQTDKIRTEVNELPYRCETCAKNFTTWKKFYYHNRFHNKNIECTMQGCTKKFVTKGDLEKHMRTHTGDKPFECDLCSRRFTQKGTLKVHRVTVHSLNKETVNKPSSVDS